MELAPEAKRELQKLEELLSLGFIGEVEYERRKSEIVGHPTPSDSRSERPIETGASGTSDAVASSFVRPQLPMSAFNALLSWDQRPADTGAYRLPDFGSDTISPAFMRNFFNFAHWDVVPQEVELPQESRREQEVNTMPLSLPDPVKVPQGPDLMAPSTAMKVRSAPTRVSLFRALAEATAVRGQSAYRTRTAPDQIVVYFRYLTDGPVQLELSAPMPLHQVVGRFIGWGIANAALRAVGTWRNRQAMWITERDATVPAGHYVLCPAQVTRFRSGWQLRVHALHLNHSFVAPGGTRFHSTAAWSSKPEERIAGPQPSRLAVAAAHMQFILAARSSETRFLLKAAQIGQACDPVERRSYSIPTRRLSLRRSVSKAEKDGTCFLCQKAGQSGSILCSDHHDKRLLELYLLIKGREWLSNREDAIAIGPDSALFPPMPLGVHETERPLDPTLPAPWRAPRFAYVDPQKGFAKKDAAKLRQMGFSV